MPKVIITSEHPPANVTINERFVLSICNDIFLKTISLLQSKSYSRKFVASDGGELAKGKMNNFGYFHMKHHGTRLLKIWLSNHTLGPL